MGAERELQEMLLKLRNLQNQADLLNQQILMTQSSIAECERAMESIRMLQQSGQNQQLLVPLGAGCYIYVYLPELNQVLVGTGAGVLLNKPPDQALEYLERKKSQLEQSRERSSMMLARIQQQLQELQPQIQERLRK